jgi:hypothetical protein
LFCASIDVSIIPKLKFLINDLISDANHKILIFKSIELLKQFTVENNNSKATIEFEDLFQQISISIQQPIK